MRWTLERPGGGWVSVRLSCERPPAEMSLEVADSTRAVRSVGSAAAERSRLYEAMALAFFRLRASSSQPFRRNQRPD